MKKTTKNHIPVEFIAASKERKMNAAMEYLKSAIVNSDNLNQIKIKMVETMTHRIEMMQNEKLDLMESFPFLFASVELVSNE